MPGAADTVVRFEDEDVGADLAQSVQAIQAAESSADDEVLVVLRGPVAIGHDRVAHGCFILGLDADTPEVFDEVLAFVRESGLYEVQVTFLTAFPGTPLYRRLHAEGRIIRENAWELCTLFDINLRPKSMSVAELQKGFLRLVRELYSADETATRRSRFKRMLKESPHFGARTRMETAPFSRRAA